MQSWKALSIWALQASHSADIVGDAAHNDKNCKPHYSLYSRQNWISQAALLPSSC